MLPQTRPGRLHFILQRNREDVFEPDYLAEVPHVRFVAYGRHAQVSGWVRLVEDRLTDLLNAHEELLLTDAEIERIDDGATRSSGEVLIHRSELVAVHASGPRGDEARRRPTRTHPVAMQAGSYLIGGYLHVPLGGDPIASLADRPMMIPLTDAWIESRSRGEHVRQSGGTLIVNRGQADWMRIVADNEVRDWSLEAVRA
jgi:hypothetical protein